MLSSIAETLERVALRQHADHVDAGLAEIRGGSGEPAALDQENLVELTVELVDRRDAIASAHEDLNRLVAAMQEVQRIVHLTDDGWPSRRASLVAELAEQPAAGIASWLGDWFQAAADLRLEALERLAEVPPPAGAELLAARSRRAAEALASRTWDLAQPLLSAGARGFSLAGREVPPPDVRVDVARMLARLAVAAAPRDEVERRLADLEDVVPRPIVTALRARTARRFGDPEEAARLARSAYAESPTDLEVAVEATVHVREEGTLTTALDMARTAVDALGSVIDVDAALARLLTEIPAEIWIAVGERALHERDERLLEYALDNADAAAQAGDYPLRAIIAEQRAAGLERAPTAERVRAQIAAGDMRLFAEEPRLARDHYEHALQLDPDDANAALSLADSLVVLSGTEPMADRRSGVLKAISILERVHAEHGFDADRAWGFAIEGEGRRALAEISAAGEHDELWRALLAAARAVAHEPLRAQRWRLLMQCATDLDLDEAALVFAEHAAEIGHDAESDDARVQALANVGRFEECLSALPTEGSDWHEAVRGYTLALTGRHPEAREILEGITLDPGWTWARGVRILLRVLAGDDRGAVTDASAMLDYFGGLYEEVADRHAVFTALAVMGRSHEAVAVVEGREEPGRTPSFAYGTAFLLAGRGEAGMEEMRRAIADASRGDLAYWRTLQSPAVQQLAAELGLGVPDFGSLKETVEERARQLEAGDDPIAQLERAETAGADPAVVAIARDAAIALVDLARGDLQAVVDRFAGETPAAADPDLRKLASHAEELLRDEAARRALPTVVADALREAEGGSAAGPAVRALLDLDAYTAAHAIRDAGGPEGVRRISDMLAQIQAAEPGEPQTAWLLLAWLRSFDPQEEPEPPSVLLELPPSWFAASEDPVSDHPLFLRHLPELRAAASTEIPGVRVRVEAELEPDGYRIWWGEAPPVEGHADPALRWVHRDTLPLLPEPLAGMARPDPERSLLAIPAEAVEAAGPLAELLTVPALEMVTRAVGDAVAEREPSQGNVTAN